MKNARRLRAAMNGLGKMEDLCHLQVNGRSQLMKEIEEVAGMQEKHLDMGAVHRNEVT